MAKRGSSGRWLDEHRRDEYVLRARREGRIARSAYKLMDIDERDHILRPGARVVDLGAAPGGWSEYAAQKIGTKGVVFALDRLEMAPLPGVTVIQGDFSEDATLEYLEERLDGAPLDVVLSDMSPNFSGTRDLDQVRSMALAELALAFAREALAKRGTFLVKVFHGEGFDGFVRDLRAYFKKVAVRKPAASRARSRETYLLGCGLK
ncbi:MAG: 23S rRNA methyltransferase [Gammaproteobacteria bacterium]|nr:23S rRNA methyltransferase [Gammaproteobacteria bacterium]